MYCHRTQFTENKSSVPEKNWGDLHHHKIKTEKKVFQIICLKLPVM